MALIRERKILTYLLTCIVKLLTLVCSVLKQIIEQITKFVAHFQSRGFFYMAYVMELVLACFDKVAVSRVKYLFILNEDDNSSFTKVRQGKEGLH